MIRLGGIVPGLTIVLLPTHQTRAGVVAPADRRALLNFLCDAPSLLATIVVTTIA